MKFFMHNILVHENDWKGEDIHINDMFHSAACWGDCYKEEDFLYLAPIKLKFRTRRDTKYFYIWWSDREIARLNLHSEPFTLEQVKEKLKEKNRIYILIELDGKKVGYITGKLTESGIDIGMMIYHYKHRNKRLAQKIFKIAKPILKKFNKIEACTISDNAKHLLNKLGFNQKDEKNFVLEK